MGHYFAEMNFPEEPKTRMMTCPKCKEETDFLAYVARDLVTGIYKPDEGTIDITPETIEEEWFKCPNCLETLATGEWEAEKLFPENDEEEDEEEEKE